MQKKYKVGLVILVILILLVGGILVGSFFHQEKKVEKVTKQVDSIAGYSYTLDDRDTSLMKDVFVSLKEVLESDEIDFQKYAEYLSELFIIDTFTINNKINKYDVPALEYLDEESIANFKLLIEDTIYKYVEDDTDGKRLQVLPEVASINMDNIVEDVYMYQDTSYPSFVVSLNWKYEKDMGYDSKAKITLIKKNDKLFIVKYQTLDSEVQDETNI